MKKLYLRLLIFRVLHVLFFLIFIIIILQNIIKVFFFVGKN
jgi:hypothetical protein